jgi:hypothetical protein
VAQLLFLENWHGPSIVTGVGGGKGGDGDEGGDSGGAGGGGKDGGGAGGAGGCGDQQISQPELVTLELVLQTIRPSSSTKPEGPVKPQKSRGSPSTVSTRASLEQRSSYPYSYEYVSSGSNVSTSNASTVSGMAGTLEIVQLSSLP